MNLTYVVYGDGSTTFRYKGLCGREINYTTDYYIPLYCWSHTLPLIENPGHLPECPMCLIGACSEIKRNKFGRAQE